MGAEGGGFKNKYNLNIGPVLLLSPAKGVYDGNRIRPPEAPLKFQPLGGLCGYRFLLEDGWTVCAHSYFCIIKVCAQCGSGMFANGAKGCGYLCDEEWWRSRVLAPQAACWCNCLSELVGIWHYWKLLAAS